MKNRREQIEKGQKNVKNGQGREVCVRKQTTGINA